MVRIYLGVFAIAMGSVALGVIFYGGHLPKLKTFQKSESSPTWTVVSREPSFYGNHVVVDFSSSAGGQWRGLLTVGLINNRVNPEGVSVSTFSHALEAMSVSTNPAAKNILVLGLGAGIIPRNLKRKGIDVEVVELDPAVEAIAREYFSFNSEDIPVFIEDARTFVRKCPRKYDAIIVDLFSGDGIPSHVVTQEFFSDVRYCLSDNSALVMNSFYGNKDQRSKKGLFRTITSVFESVVVFEPPSKETSEIVQGYILANKNAKWSYNISLEDKPSFVIERLTPIFRNGTVYREEGAFLKDTLPIRDVKNDWRRISNAIDVKYRERLTGSIPWQVLLD